MKAMDMKSRIELELRGKDAATIKELNLDSCRGQQIEGLTEVFQNLDSLSLINVGLTNLRGFPKLPCLKKLELSDNRISNGLDNLVGCTNLTHLNLSNNKIKELEVLGPLAKLESLTHLDLFNCEVTQIENYREKVFKLVPNLKYLDGFDKNEQEEEEFEGQDEDDDDDEEVEEGEGEEDDEEDDDEFDEDEDDDDDENDVGLSYLQKSNLPEDEDDADFDEKKALEQAGEEDEEDDDEEDDDEVEEEELEGAEEQSEAVSLKRKHQEDEEESAQ